MTSCGPFSKTTQKISPTDGKPVQQPANPARPEQGGAPVITGGHVVISSTDPEADRIFMRDVLKLTGVDVGGGWLIFGLPPSEIALHPFDKNNVHEFFLMCDDIGVFIEQMKRHNIKCDRVQKESWGRLSRLTLPGGGKLGVYQSGHPRPEAMGMDT
jgi:hypothetical protein